MSSPLTQMRRSLSLSRRTPTTSSFFKRIPPRNVSSGSVLTSRRNIGSPRTSLCGCLTRISSPLRSALIGAFDICHMPFGKRSGKILKPRPPVDWHRFFRSSALSGTTGLIAASAAASPFSFRCSNSSAVIFAAFDPAPTFPRRRRANRRRPPSSSWRRGRESPRD